MATVARSAPRPERSALVEDPDFQEMVQRSRSLVERILLSIPSTHESCIHIENLQLNSSDNSKFELMASKIGIPTAPVMRVVSESFTLQTSLTHMLEGFELHRALLSSVFEQLRNKNKLADLMADIRDLIIQTNKMLKMVQKDVMTQPTPTPVVLQLQGEYDVQVAAHLTLVQLQGFGQDTVRCLRSLDQSNEEETES
uniref:Colony stimulating factor 3 (granulocyte) a n=1 Tax=Echeneis naucrates TaxID=173247 RepID=A0A665V0C2_ECHNA